MAVLDFKPSFFYTTFPFMLLPSLQRVSQALLGLLYFLHSKRMTSKFQILAYSLLFSFLKANVGQLNLCVEIMNFRSGILSKSH